MWLRHVANGTVVSQADDVCRLFGRERLFEGDPQDFLPGLPATIESACFGTAGTDECELGAILGKGRIRIIARDACDPLWQLLSVGHGTYPDMSACFVVPGDICEPFAICRKARGIRQYIAFGVGEGAEVIHLGPATQPDASDSDKGDVFAIGGEPGPAEHFGAKVTLPDRSFDIESAPNALFDGGDKRDVGAAFGLDIGFPELSFCGVDEVLAVGCPGKRGVGAVCGKAFLIIPIEMIE